MNVELFLLCVVAVITAMTLVATAAIIHTITKKRAEKRRQQDAINKIRDKW